MNVTTILNLEHYRFIKELQKISDANKMGITIGHKIQDDEFVVVFYQKEISFGLKYEKINHLTYANVMEWVESNFYVKTTFGVLADAMNAFEKRRKLEKKFSKTD